MEYDYYVCKYSTETLKRLECETGVWAFGHKKPLNILEYETGDFLNWCSSTPNKGLFRGSGVEDVEDHIELPLDEFVSLIKEHYPKEVKLSEAYTENSGELIGRLGGNDLNVEFMCDYEDYAFLDFQGDLNSTSTFVAIISSKIKVSNDEFVRLAIEHFKLESKKKPPRVKAEPYNPHQNLIQKGWDIPVCEISISDHKGEPTDDEILLLF